MQCLGNPEEKCIKSVCCMWADDVRCPNFEWLAPDKAKARAKKAGELEAITITEKDQLLSIMKRLKDNGGIDDYYLSQARAHDGESTIEVDSNGWHGYGIRFNFDKAGNITTMSAGA